MIFCGTAVAATAAIHVTLWGVIFLATKLGIPPVLVPLGILGAVLGAAWEA